MLGCGSILVGGVSWSINLRILAFECSRSLSFWRTVSMAPSPLMMKSKHLSIDRCTLASSFCCVCLWRFRSRRSLTVSSKKAEAKASRSSSRPSRIFLSPSINHAQRRSAWMPAGLLLQALFSWLLERHYCYLFTKVMVPPQLPQFTSPASKCL